MNDPNRTLLNKKRRRPRAESVSVAVDHERAEFERRRQAQIAKASLELDNVDAQILQLLLRFPGLSQTVIGQHVGLTRQAVAHRVRAQKFKRALYEAHRVALDVYQSNQAAAARKLGALIHSDDATIALRACIAHLWPIIHRDPQDSTGHDFAQFISEAYELASKQRTATRARPAGRKLPPAPPSSGHGI